MTSAYELTGRFGGFVFTEEGKRRMLLRGSGDDRLLKVPRILRRRIVGKFPVGQLISVAVMEERDPETGVVKQVVSHVLPDIGGAVASFLPTPSVAPSATCVVRVCSKKNCWRNGGRELFDALNREAAVSPHVANIEIRQVGCLDRCKHGPNADGGRQAYTRCSPREAGTIIARAVGNLPCHEIETR